MHTRTGACKGGRQGKGFKGDNKELEKRWESNKWDAYEEASAYMVGRGHNWRMACTT